MNASTQVTTYLQVLTKSTHFSVLIFLLTAALGTVDHCTLLDMLPFSSHVPTFLFSPAFLSHFPFSFSSQFPPALSSPPDNYDYPQDSDLHASFAFALFRHFLSYSVSRRPSFYFIAHFLLTSRPTDIGMSTWMFHIIFIFILGSLADFYIALNIPSPPAFQANKTETSESLWTLPTCHHSPIPLYMQHLLHYQFSPILPPKYLSDPPLIPMTIALV